MTLVLENVLSQLAGFRNRATELPRSLDDLRSLVRPWCDLRREIDPQELVDELLMLE